MLFRSEVAGPAKALVGMAFQNPTMLPWLTILDNVMIPMRIVEPYRSTWGEKRAEYEAKALALLATVGLKGFERKHTWELSGGMLQRASLVRALIHEPRLLLLDEPFGALDALTRAHLQDELLKIVAKTKSTVLMVTHDVDEAVLLSDRIVMMTNGPAATIGDIVEVDLARPRDRLALVNDSRYHHLRGRVLEFLYQKQLRPAA